MAYLDDYEEEKKFPVKIAVIAGIVLLAVIVAVVLTVSMMAGQGEKPEDTGDGTDDTEVTFVDEDGKGRDTTTNIPEDDGTDEPVESITDVEGDDETGTDDGSEQTPAEVVEQPDYSDPKYKSSSIPIEEKMKSTPIDDSTEEQYSQYGALNIQQMKDVASKWMEEWGDMLNDGQWDRHSTVLKSLMDHSYVNNHSKEFKSILLYQCLHDTLYVSNESKYYEGIKSVNIVNSVPSPLAYVTIVTNVTYQELGTDPAETERTKDTITYRLAMNRNYQVCQFHVAY